MHEVQMTTTPEGAAMRVRARVLLGGVDITHRFPPAVFRWRMVDPTRQGSAGPWNIPEFRGNKRRGAEILVTPEELGDARKVRIICDVVLK